MNKLGLKTTIDLNIGGNNTDRIVINNTNEHKMKLWSYWLKEWMVIYNPVK